jgi:hypothetical protein
MLIWPFAVGQFVELHYTFVRVFKLTVVLGEITIRLWLQKVDLIERY